MPKIMMMNPIKVPIRVGRIFWAIMRKRVENLAHLTVIPGTFDDGLSTINVTPPLMPSHLKFSDSFEKPCLKIDPAGTQYANA